MISRGNWIQTDRTKCWAASLYQAMKERGTIQHVLVRHEEGGTHAAGGYSRASAYKIGAKLAEPVREVVAVVGDLSIRFLIEELAVATQHRVGFVMVLLNNAYLGLIRQAERGYNLDFQVQTSFKNRNAPEIGDYGVDHVRAVEALGGIGLRVTDPSELQEALRKARALFKEHSIPVALSTSGPARPVQGAATIFGSHRKIRSRVGLSPHRHCSSLAQSPRLNHKHS
jgi:glyoxylate carboligase